MSTDAPAMTRRRANTRARLVEAVGEVMQERGLDGVSVDALVAAAGFTRGAFYSNFSSLNEVFGEYFRVTSTSGITSAAAAIDAIPVGELTIDAVLDVLDALHGRDLGAYVSSRELELRAVRDPGAAELYRAFQRDMVDQIAPLVERVLTRMGRRPVVPAGWLAVVISQIYIDSLGRELHGLTDPNPREQRRATLVALAMGASAPLDGAEPCDASGDCREKAGGAPESDAPVRGTS